MNEPKAGKYLLEILTRGMYSNPMHIYREYIQNACDALDRAVSEGIQQATDGVIHISIDADKQSILIRDNGCGISHENAKATLLSIGASEKDGICERGFRGIGRLGGLAYAKEVRFITSAMNEPVKTTMFCDCERLEYLLQKTNTETTDLMDTIMAISRFESKPEIASEHYFEVELIGVSPDSGLLDENSVNRYISETAPIDFDSQKFIQANKIREEFARREIDLTCYKILMGKRKQPRFKLYSRSLSTGKQARTKSTDYVRDIEFVYKESSDGSPLYMGWLAITDFSGSIRDEAVQGIRFRKGNILVGDNSTFDSFFPLSGLEASRANKMFAGEIHVLHNEILPNSQRDNFEPSVTYNEMKASLRDWAGEINKKYRRGTSVANSSLRKINELNQQQYEVEDKLRSGIVSSDEKRDQLAKELDTIFQKRSTEMAKVRKALDHGIFDPERSETIHHTLAQTETADKDVPSLSRKITNAGYATKDDLPSSYSREERKLYQRIISIVDSFFVEKPDIAERLRDAIKSELSVKKK